MVSMYMFCECSKRLASTSYGECDIPEQQIRPPPEPGKLIAPCECSSHLVYPAHHLCATATRSGSPSRIIGLFAYSDSRTFLSVFLFVGLAAFFPPVFGVHETCCFVVIPYGVLYFAAYIAHLVLFAFLRTDTGGCAFMKRPPSFSFK